MKIYYLIKQKKEQFSFFLSKYYVTFAITNILIFGSN